MITGADIRRYRKILGLGQVDFAKRLAISQPALSGLEGGRVSVSESYLDLLKDRFSSPSFHPSFADFLRTLQRDNQAPDPLALAVASRHVTLIVWRWHKAIDLGVVPGNDQMSGLVTVPASDRATLAFEMTDSTSEWTKGDVLIFSECKPFELRAGKPCIIQTRRGKRSRTFLGLAKPNGSAIKFQDARGGTQTIPSEAILASFREELRVMRADR